MKKLILMTLFVMLFGTVCNAKVNGTEDEAKTPDGVEAVDLGLSVKWANMNVGAKKDSGFGTYFAWGETKPKKYYSWGTYAWSRGDTQFLVLIHGGHAPFATPIDVSGIVGWHQLKNPVIC